MKRVYRTGGYAESIEDRRLCREYRGQEVMQRVWRTGRLCREYRGQEVM